MPVKKSGNRLRKISAKAAVEMTTEFPFKTKQASGALRLATLNEPRKIRSATKLLFYLISGKRNR
jgi:hypothetical protein